MIRSYFDVIVSSKKFSFKKNKIILHPHRVIGLLLLARFSGDIEAVDHRILL